MTQKIVVTRAGHEALTEADKNEYIFHSDYNTFKIIAEGTLSTQAISASPTTITVAHGQDAAPAVYAFVEFPDGYTTIPTGRARNTTSPVQRYWLVEVDGTNIYFMCYKGTSANYNVNIKYYIFETPV